MNQDNMMMKALYGQNAKHVHGWIKVQRASDDTVSFVGASRCIDLMYGGKHAHTLVIGELIVRPHLVFSSNHCQGHGLAGLAREMDVDAWVNGDCLVNPMGLTIDPDSGKLIKI
jgi:hypothetical protein